MARTNDEMAKCAIVDALTRLAFSKPGLESGNYSTTKAYNADRRRVSQDLHDCRDLLLYIEYNADVSYADVVQGFKANHRLSYGTVDHICVYAAGQYYPREYRRAIAIVAAEAIRISKTRTLGLGPITLRRELQDVFGRSITRRYF